MITVKKDVRPEEIRQSARHTLFVEGSGDNQIDVQVLRDLLRNRVRIEPLGASFHIRSAAEALVSHHPDYYFLIDRDHHEDSFVEECWSSFPDPSKSNLLVWRRRQLESYFLDPDYLIKSIYLSVDRSRLVRAIQEAADKRLYLDAANNVIIQLRESQKQTWIQLFTRADQFRSQDDAIKRLQSLPEIPGRKSSICRALRKDSLKRLFLNCLCELSGGRPPLQLGRGRWLHLMDAKRLLPSIVNTCFRVVDNQGNLVQGKQAITEVARELVRKDISEQPEDFAQLDRLIRDRVEAN